jgi:hypothetical protein
MYFSEYIVCGTPTTFGGPDFGAPDAAVLLAVVAAV